MPRCTARATRARCRLRSGSQLRLARPRQATPPGQRHAQARGALARAGDAAPRTAEQSALSRSPRFEQCQQPLEQLDWARWAAADMEVDWHDGGNSAEHGVTAEENTAVQRAVTDRHNPFRIRRRVIR